MLWTNFFVEWNYEPVQVYLNKEYRKRGGWLACSLASSIHILQIYRRKFNDTGKQSEYHDTILTTGQCVLHAV